ncbi:MAG: diguanylate cyclase, partial [Erysipelothrix sp.]|nr:diguanylate cyclase [Erysipelothrix sp.]
MTPIKPDDKVNTTHHSQVSKKPWRTVIGYALFGFLWILFSDQLLAFFVQDAALYATIQTYKGWFYVVLTSVALYFLVKLDYRHILKLNQQLQDQHQTLEAAYKESIALEEELKEKIGHILDKQKFIDTVLDYSQVAIVIWNYDGVVMDANSYYLELLGRKSKEVIGKRWLDFYDGDTEKPKLEAMIESLRMGRNVKSIENKLYKSDGTFSHILWNNSIVQGNEISDTYIVSFGLNITKERENELKVISLAYEDSLTGLSNRIAFEKDIETAIESGISFALFYMDIDQFNALNDLHGHSYGDLFLKQLAELLKTCCTDMKVYRWSGDDFILCKIYPYQDQSIKTLMESDVK